MGQKIGDRYYEGDPCLLCLRWHCNACGHPHGQTTKSLTAPPVKVCSACHSTDGEYRTVIHRDAKVNAVHRSMFESEKGIIPHDREQIRDLQALVDFLTPLVESYRRQWRRALGSATESTEHNAAVNSGNKILLSVDDLVRHWVKDHPPEHYHGHEHQ